MTSRVRVPPPYPKPGPSPDPVAEAKLIADVLLGDRKAIGEFIHHFSDQVFSFLSRRVDDKAVVDDLCQEVFLAAWAQLRQLSGQLEPEDVALRDRAA